MPPVDIAELERLARAATPGEWDAGCFADPEAQCQCKYVFGGGYAGSIAQISVDNSKSIQEGGNDSPPVEEARANLRYIAAAHPQAILRLCEEVREMREALRGIVERFDAADAGATAIISEEVLATARAALSEK